MSSTETEWIPLEAAIERLHSTRLHVLMLIKQGLLEGEERDGQWFVAQDGLGGSCAPKAKLAGGCRKHATCGGCS